MRPNSVEQYHILIQTYKKKLSVLNKCTRKRDQLHVDAESFHKHCSSSAPPSGVSAAVHLLQQLCFSILEHLQNSEHDICALLHEHRDDGEQGSSEEQLQRISFNTSGGAALIPVGIMIGSKL